MANHQGFERFEYNGYVSVRGTRNAKLAYHLLTFYDKIRAVYTIFRNYSNGGLELNHRFAYLPIRLNRYGHTTRLLQLAPGTGREPLEGVSADECDDQDSPMGVDLWRSVSTMQSHTAGGTAQSRK